jgi:glycosyltransferase involved in cell wall biosynthesis
MITLFSDPISMSASTNDSMPQKAQAEIQAHRPIRVLCATLFGDRPEAAQFIGLHRAGCDVTVYCMPQCPFIEAFRAAGMRVIPEGFRGRFDRRAIWRLRQELGRREYDVVHLLHNRPVSNGLRALKGFPRPRVVVYRGTVGHVSPWSPLSWYRYLNPRIDRVVCVSEAVRQYFLGLRLGAYAFPRQKPVTIYKGHELAWYAGPPTDLAEFDIPADAFVVGCVANMRPRKGVEVLVDAFGRLPESLPIYLLLVGSMDSAALDRAIAHNRNTARIRKVGYRRDAPAIIAGCSVSVLTTLRGEGLPKTVVEAMARGVPPIVTNAGGSPELVEHGRSGLVVPPGDPAALAAAILELYDQPALRAELGAAAQRRIATDFSSVTTVQRTLDLYRELLQEPRGGGA